MFDELVQPGDRAAEGAAPPLDARRGRLDRLASRSDRPSRRYSRHCLNVIWIAAAAGIASMAPMTPNSVEPKSTATSTTKGSISVARFWIWGWIR